MSDFFWFPISSIAWLRNHYLYA